jgi:hypothetical protein
VHEIASSYRWSRLGRPARHPKNTVYILQARLISTDESSYEIELYFQELHKLEGIVSRKGETVRL